MRNYSGNEDVFNTFFCFVFFFSKTVVFHGAVEDDVEFSTNVREYLTQLGNERVAFLSGPLLHLVHTPAGEESSGMYESS